MQKYLLPLKTRKLQHLSSWASLWGLFVEGTAWQSEVKWWRPALDSFSSTSGTPLRGSGLWGGGVVCLWRVQANTRPLAGALPGYCSPAPVPQLISTCYLSGLNCQQRHFLTPLHVWPRPHPHPRPTTDTLSIRGNHFRQEYSSTPSPPDGPACPSTLGWNISSIEWF